MLNFDNQLNISSYKNQEFLYDFYNIEFNNQTINYLSITNTNIDLYEDDNNSEFNNQSINYLCITNAYIEYESCNNFMFDIANFIYDKYVIYFNSSIEKKLKEIEYNNLEKLNKVNISENLEKIKNIKLLENNWNSYGARPLSENLCDKVINLINNVIVQPKIFPTANDSILFEYYDRNKLKKYLGFEIFENNIEVFEIYNNGDTNELNENFGIEDINNFIRKFYGIK